MIAGEVTPVGGRAGSWVGGDRRFWPLAHAIQGYLY